MKYFAPTTNNEQTPIRARTDRTAPNHYANYTWIEPRDVVKQAKRQTRSLGIFPTPFDPFRLSRIGKTVFGVASSIVRNPAAIAATMLLSFTSTLSLLSFMAV